jgi:hypothetical protein
VVPIPPTVERPQTHRRLPNVANAASSSPDALANPESSSHAKDDTIPPRSTACTTLEAPADSSPNASPLISFDEQSCRSFSDLAQAPALGDTRPSAPSRDEEDPYYDEPYYDAGVRFVARPIALISGLVGE